MTADLALADAGELARLFERGEASPVEATQAALNEIDRHRDLNAFRLVDHERALADARASAARWRRGAALGPIDGVPATVKDLVLTRGWATLRGSRLIDPNQAWDNDAPAVARLRQAGAILLGKTTTPEFGWKGVTDSPLTGFTRNPWDPQLTPGGSSGGAAVAAAAGMGALHIGTAGGGSIRIPASYCGIVGLKPTYGLIPYTGILPIELTVDHTGPMSRNVHDNALLLEAVAGADGLDPRQYAPRTTAYRAGLSQGVEGLRIGVVREGFATPESEPGVDAKVRDAADQLRRLGASVEEISIPAHTTGRVVWTPSIIEGWLDLVLRNNGGGTNHTGVFLASATDALAAWRQYAAELSVPIKVQILVGEFMHRRYNGHFYGKSQNLVRRLRGDYDEPLGTTCDLLLMPTTPQTPTRLPAQDAPLEEVWQLALDMNRNTAPFCATGHPAITVPCGLSDGLPVGMMLIGRHWDEATVYRAAYAFEQSGNWRDR